MSDLLAIVWDYTLRFELYRPTYFYSTLTSWVVMTLMALNSLAHRRVR